MNIYVLQAQGYGDFEDGFENVGTFDTVRLVDDARTALRLEDSEVVTHIEVFELNNLTLGE